MKALVLAGVAASALMFGSLAPAAAQGGCGPYAHRAWNGFCRPNVRPFPVYGYGWHRPWGYGYGYRRPWGWHRW